MRGSKIENANKKGPSRVSEWREKKEKEKRREPIREYNMALSVYLVFFPLFFHLTHSSLGGCWEKGLSNI